MICNSGTCSRSDGTAPLIWPRNRCIVCGPFYHRNQTWLPAPCPASPTPSTCHKQTWSKVDMQTGNAPPFLSSTLHEWYDRKVRQKHHLSTQISTQSRSDSHDASLLRHMHDCSSVLLNNNIHILSSGKNSPGLQFYIYHIHCSDTAVSRHHHRRVCILHRSTFPCIHHN